METDEAILERLEVLKDRAKEANEIVKRYESLTWIKQLQEPNEKKRLKKLEQMQRTTFRNIIKKRHPELLDEWQDLFAEFFIDFLAEKCKSINDFLYKERLADDELKKLKRRFQNDKI